MYGVSSVFHLAAQVAVTSSLERPVDDFEVNARGTLNVLEAMRRAAPGVPLLFTSTNKVYGNLTELRLRATEERYEPEEADLCARGVSERWPLVLQSPYGCSKGCADQYVLDYARTFGLQATVFRMSCIFGPRQLGTEDQGWVTHFVRGALERRTLTIYGDGRQVRDLLFIEDLLDALILARDNIGRLRGEAFNVGGGPLRSVSLLELRRMLEHLIGRAPRYRWEGWRPADQRYFVSDTSKLQAAVGWAPRVDVAQGLLRTTAWVAEGLGDAPVDGPATDLVVEERLSP